MRYETTTKLSPDETLAEIERFFAGEMGLTVRTRGPRAIGLEGGGGHVAVTVSSERPTTLQLETREWDQQVESFIRELPR